MQSRDNASRISRWYIQLNIMLLLLGLLRSGALWPINTTLPGVVLGVIWAVVLLGLAAVIILFDQRPGAGTTGVLLAVLTAMGMLGMLATAQTYEVPMQRIILNIVVIPGMLSAGLLASWLILRYENEKPALNSGYAPLQYRFFLPRMRRMARMAQALGAAQPQVALTIHKGRIWTELPDATAQYVVFTQREWHWRTFGRWRWYIVCNPRWSRWHPHGARSWPHGFRRAFPQFKIMFMGKRIAVEGASYALINRLLRQNSGVLTSRPPQAFPAWIVISIWRTSHVLCEPYLRPLSVDQLVAHVRWTGAVVQMATAKPRRILRKADAARRPRRRGWRMRR